MNPDELYIKWASVWMQCLYMQPVWDFINRSFFSRGMSWCTQTLPFWWEAQNGGMDTALASMGSHAGSPAAAERTLGCGEIHNRASQHQQGFTEAWHRIFFIDIQLLCGTCFRQHEQKHRYLDMHPQGKVIWVIQRSEIAT